MFLLKGPTGQSLPLLFKFKATLRLYVNLKWGNVSPSQNKDEKSPKAKGPKYCQF